jgi:Xaa-Pro aminopeptidase
MSSSAQILASLREELAIQGLDAFIVGSEDRHQSEYVCEADMRRQFVSRFKGSAGTALVLKDKALLWTDGRYFLQAENELSSDWTLMKSGQKDVPDMNKWIIDNLTAGQVVGIDSWLVSSSAAKQMETTFEAKGVVLKGVEINPVDLIWTGRPASPTAPLIVLPSSTTGLTHSEKIKKIRNMMLSSGAVGVLVTMLDDVAWLLNLRGGDIAFNPVFFSYALVTEHTLQLFIDPMKITDTVREHLGPGVELFPYAAIEAALQLLAARGKVLVDPSKVSWKLHRILGEAALQEVSSIQLAKSVKNAAELEGMRACHVRDGAALTAFLHWLEVAVTAAPHTINECDVVAKLEVFRGQLAGHVGPSFATIAGYGGNGAIIHYQPAPASCATLGTDSIFLLDSGAQYLDGTTDVTRTMHFGTPSQHMKTCYTAVLKVRWVHGSVLCVNCVCTVYCVCVLCTVCV